MPNTAMSAPSATLPAAIVALITLGGLGYIGRRNLMAVIGRR